MNQTKIDLLTPPQGKPRADKSEKRWAQTPDTSTLTEQQGVVFNEMLEFLESNQTMYLLSGYAGSGKTYLISTFIEYVLTTHKKSICMTAPTNKAVRVLKTMATYKDANLEYKTIHSLLGLKEKIDGFGNQTFEQIYREDASIENHDIVVIDEVSMLSDDLLVGAKGITGILDYLETMGGKLKVIFVGDEMQIPPVGKDKCLPFSVDWRDANDVQRGRLTDIVRQSQGNPMIELTLKIRNALGRADIIPNPQSKYNEETLEGVHFLTSKEDINAVLEAYFCNDNFKENSDYFKALAWTNKAVDALNKLVRIFMYGKNPKKLYIGECLIADKPILAREDVESGNPSITTNAELRVEDLEEEDGNYEGAPLKWYNVKVRVDDDKLRTIRIVHEDSQEDYELIVQYLKEQALAEKKGTWQAADKWKEYYELEKVFAQVKYNYAITCHKSQGSTYEHCIVFMSDIDQNRKITERNRIKYTAVTRPSKRLFIVM